MRNGEQDWLAEAEVEDKLGKAGQVEGIHALFPNRESLMRFFFTGGEILMRFLSCVTQLPQAIYSKSRKMSGEQEQQQGKPVTKN